MLTRGTASELAKTARVGFATAYRELKRMESFGLVWVTVADGREEYAAAADHPEAELVRRLVRASSVSTPPRDPVAEQTRRRLRALGAPLPVSPAEVSEEEREEALVDGVRLAHRDATLARVLPVVFWRQWRHLDRKRLKETARRAREKHAVGFVAALTAKLAGDRSLEHWAEGLRDHRVTTMRPFFELPSAHASRALAEQRTPAVARDWGFLMDLDYASFETAFNKSVGPR